MDGRFSISPWHERFLTFYKKRFLAEQGMVWKLKRSQGLLKLLFSVWEGYVIYLTNLKTGEFIKQLGEGKGQTKLIVSEDKKGVMTYNEKAECLQAKFHYGYWNSIGIRQHWIQKVTGLFRLSKWLNCCYMEMVLALQTQSLKKMADCVRLTQVLDTMLVEPYQIFSITQSNN